MITRLLQLVNQPFVYRLGSYAWLGFTCYLLFKPGLGFEQVVFFPGEDKLAHLLLFLNLTFLWGLNFSQTFDLHAVFISKILAIVGILFAGLSEWIQDYIPNRGMDAADFLFDSMGILFGITMFFFVEKRLNDVKIS
jgi:VanZ family protein